MNEIEFLKKLETKSELNDYNKRKLKKAIKKEQKIEKRKDKKWQKEEMNMASSGTGCMIERCDQRIKEGKENGKITFIRNDDIYQLYEDGELLSSLKVTELKKIGIIKISQLKEMRASIKTDKDRENTIKKISKAYGVGPKLSARIIDVVEYYAFPENNVTAINDEVEKENKIFTTSQIKEEPAVKEDGKIDIPKYVENLIEESDLADILLDTVLDLANKETHIGLIEFNPSNGKTERTGGSNIIFNTHTLLIENVFLKREFDKVINDLDVRLLGENEREKDKYFMIALKSIEDYIKISWKCNTKFYYTRKDYTGNRLNYIQFNIEKVENRMNRKLSFANCKKAASRLNSKDKANEITNKPAVETKATAEVKNNTKIPIGISEDFSKLRTVSINYLTDKKEGTKMTIRLNPLKSSEYIPGMYVAAFEVLVKNGGTVIKDKFNFDNIGKAEGKEDYKKKGQVLYVFEKNLIKQGYYVIPKDLKDIESDIKYQIQQFYS